MLELFRFGSTVAAESVDGTVSSGLVDAVARAGDDVGVRLAPEAVVPGIAESLECRVVVVAVLMDIDPISDVGGESDARDGEFPVEPNGTCWVRQ